MPEAAVTPLFFEAQVQDRVSELAQAIAAALPPRFTLVGLLKGSFVFTADLARALSKAGCSPRIEFMRVSSYGGGTTSSGIVSLMGDAPDGVKGEPVLLVDDIQDTGRTLAFTREFLLERGADRVWTCTLLDKPSRREVAAAEVDFVGFAIPDVFVVGYGIDYAERYRELPFIGRIAS
jgi:hypoxanthine phosphoribosyltransferase